MTDVIAGDSKNFITYNKAKRKLLFHHSYTTAPTNLNFSKIRLWNSINSNNIVKILAISHKRIVKEYFVGDNIANIIDPTYLDYYLEQSIETVKKIYVYFKTFPGITEKSILILPNKMVKLKEFISPAYNPKWFSFSENINNVIDIFLKIAGKLSYRNFLFDEILRDFQKKDIAIVLKEIDEYFYKNDVKPPKSNDSFLFKPLFVGRVDELQSLNSILDDTVNHSRGSTVVIHGGKGVGKTRLTLEFVDSHKDLVRSQARASKREFSTLLSMLESFEALNASLLTKKDKQVLNDILKLLPSAKTSIDNVSDINKISFEISKFIGKLTSKHAIIVAIDDFDEIDDKSLFVLNNQIKLSSYFPIMLVINSETKFAKDRITSKNIHFIKLNELDTQSTEILVVSVFGDNDFVNQSFVKWISSISHNIPLNVIEILKYLVNSYQIFFKDGKWVTQKEHPEDFNVPSELNDMILDSYSSLDPLERKLLNYVVCDSEGFTFGELKNISNLDSKKLNIVLQSLSNKNYIISNRKKWVCSSANIRDSLYKKIDDKTKYHKDILRYLERNSSPSIRIIDHYIRADMVRKAAEILFSYARELFSAGKVDYAADAIEGLLVLYNRMNRSIKNIKTYAMKIFSRAGRYQEVITTYGIGDNSNVFAMIYKLRALVHLNKVSEAKNLANWFELNINDYDNITKFKILNEIAYLYYRFGDLDRALYYIGEIDKLDKNGFSRYSYIELYKMKAIVYSMIGHRDKKYFDLSVDLYNIVLELSKIENDIINEAIAYNNLGSMYMYDNNNLAKFYLSKSANLFSEAGNIYLKSYPLSNLAMIHFVSGQTNRGMKMINDLVAMAKNFGWEYDYVEFLKSKAQMYFFTEDMEKNLDILNIIKDRVRSKDEEIVVNGQIILSKFLLHNRDIKLLKDDLERYFSYYDQMKDNIFYMVWFYYLKALTNPPKEGVKYLKNILNYKDALENFPFQVYHDIVTTYIRANDLSAAEDYGLKLLKLSIGGGAKLFEAKANTLLGLIEAKLGNKREAFVKIYNAKSMFKFMGIDVLINYCDAIVGRYSLSPTAAINEVKKLPTKVSNNLYKDLLKNSELMIYSLMDDIYTLKTFTNTILSLGKEIEINNFASLVVDQVLGLFNMHLAAFFLLDDDKSAKLLFAKDYQENVYKTFFVPKTVYSTNPNTININSEEGYIYIPILYENELKAFLYLQGQNTNYKISNFEKELLLLLPDSLSLMFQHTQLYMMAILDPLTKLYTRNYFINKMNEEFNDAKSFHLEYTVMMLDIDDFKKFNDTYGHTTGDEVLKEISKTLKSTVSDIGTIGRFGGEEFIITLPVGYLASSRIAQRINSAVNDISIPGVDRMISVSIGIASYPYVDANDYLELIDKADNALYITKSSGKNSYTVYTPKIEDDQPKVL